MKRLYPYLFFLFLCLSAQAQEFKVYQFPADKVPAIRWQYPRLGLRSG